MKRIVLVAALALALAGCSSINSGTIVSKIEEPGSYYTTMQCSYYNGKGVCAVWMPVTHYDDPDWRFNLTKGGDEGWVYVSQLEFDEYDVGDYYDER